MKKQEIVWQTALSPTEVYLVLRTQVIPSRRRFFSYFTFYLSDERKEAFAGEYDQSSFALRYHTRSWSRSGWAVELAGTYTEAGGGTTVTVSRKRTVGEWVMLACLLTMLMSVLISVIVTDGLGFAVLFALLLGVLSSPFWGLAWWMERREFHRSVKHLQIMLS